MNAETFLSEVNYALRGTDDDAPTIDTEDGRYWISVLNRKKRTLYNDITRLWTNTFETRLVGIITASTTPVYDTDRNFLGASDKVYVVTTEGQTIEYTVVKPEERNRNCREVYFDGMNPQKLHFTNAIGATENIVGGSLYLPGYYMPKDVARASDKLPFLNPDWAVLAVAGDVAGNDIVYEDKEANLNAKATELWKLMVRANRRGTYGNARKIPTVVKRIGARTRRAR